jgi:hypothetical protein
MMRGFTSARHLQRFVSIDSSDSHLLLFDGRLLLIDWRISLSGSKLRARGSRLIAFL